MESPTLHSNVRRELMDPKTNLIPMLSIVIRKFRNRRVQDFSVDYLLPVQIGDVFVGIVYRDNVPVQALMDCYDITNKAKLFDPHFDLKTLSMFNNARYNRLRVIAHRKGDKVVNTGHPFPSTESLSESKSSSESKSESNTTSPSMTPLHGYHGVDGSQVPALGTIELNRPFVSSFIPQPTMQRSEFDMLPPEQQLEHWMGYNNSEFQQYKSLNLKLTPRSPQYTM